MARNHMESISRPTVTTLKRIGSISYLTINYVDRRFSLRHSLRFCITVFAVVLNYIPVYPFNKKGKHGVGAFVALRHSGIGSRFLCVFVSDGGPKGCIICRVIGLLYQDLGSSEPAGTSCNNHNNDLLQR